MNEFKKRYKELGISLSITIKKSLRVNTLKTTNERLKKILEKKGVKLEKIPYVDNGFYYHSKFSLATTKEYLLGHFYIQEWPSQLAVEVLSPMPDETILDMAAAPGGKTTHIAQLMENRGTIIAADNKRQRLKALTENIERMGVENAIVYDIDSTDIENIEFDKILLDAPCMGNFCNDSNWFNNRTISQIKSRQKLQRKLLKKAYELLKKEGILLYSTCSLEPEENELNVQWALMNLNLELLNIKDVKTGHRGFQKPFGKPMKYDMSRTIRLYPPFFMALFKKK